MITVQGQPTKLVIPSPNKEAGHSGTGLLFQLLKRWSWKITVLGQPQAKAYTLPETN
jgi:hypothetical protein